jgi:DNA-binding LytR/AlgR family response regulator
MDALKILDKGRGFDIVVADIALQPTEPHGFALARMIRFKNPEVRVMFVTGNLEILKVEPGLEGELILYKPVELSELSEKIDELALRAA